MKLYISENMICVFLIMLNLICLIADFPFRWLACRADESAELISGLTQRRGFLGSLFLIRQNNRSNRCFLRSEMLVFSLKRSVIQRRE